MGCHSGGTNEPDAGQQAPEEWDGVNGGARRSDGTFKASPQQRRADEPEFFGTALVSESGVGLGFPVDVYVTKDHAYVVSISLPGSGPLAGGLTVFDVSDRAHPVLRKVVTLSGDTYWNSVWAKGDTLYVGSGNHGVLLFDISDPAEPRLLRGLPGDAFGRCRINGRAGC